MNAFSFARASLLATVASASALAHDFWIEPSTFRPAPDAPVQVSLRVGDGPPGEPVARNPARINTFIVHRPGAEAPAPIEGAAGADPAGAFRCRSPGVHILSYRSNLSRITLEAPEFEAYLKEEGLDSISALRAQRSQTGKPGRERYSRCAKSILIAGDAATARGFDAPAGLALELIPEKSPGAVRPDEALPVLLLHEKKPLAGASVRAFNRADGASALSARTDASGRCSFTLPTAGVWIIACTHMFEVTDDPEADWESLWASLTLQIGE